MALDMVPITGRVPMPDDTAFVSGQLILELSGPDAEGNAALAKSRVIVDLEGTDIPAGFEVFRNTSGVMNTTYKASVAAVIDIGNGLTVRRELPLGSFQIGDAASYTIGELLSSPVPDGNSVNLSILTPSEARAFMELGDLAILDKAANANLADMAANTIKGAATAGAPQDLAPAAARAVLQISDFATRADFVTWAGSNTVPTGHVINAAGLAYRYIGAGTAIADLAGWVPNDRVTPDHWAQNVTPGTTSMSAAIAAADVYCAANGGVLRFSAKSYLCDSAQVKDDSTFWEGEFTNAASGGIGTTLIIAHNGAAFTITGAQTNYQGGVAGMRVLGNRTTYPEAIAFDMAEVNDHFFNNIYMGNLQFGVRGHNCKTCNFNWLYGFGMLESSVRLYGDTRADNTDHCFIECQFAGDSYGLDVEVGNAIQLRGCRPQVSGLANARFYDVGYVSIADGFCDSAVIVSGSDGYIITNCSRVNITGNQFYSNGTGDADIVIDADSAICSDIIISNNQFDLGSSVTRTAISFGPDLGSGSIRRVSITGNNFTGMTTAIANPDRVDTELRVTGNHGVPEYVGINGPTTDQTHPYHADIYRITGTLNTDFNVDIPNARAWVGDKIEIIRVNGGSGTITLRGPNGATVGTLTGAGHSIRAVCTTASATPGSTAYVAI